MKIKGFRVAGLTPRGEIPNEVGEIHYFSLSQERAELWARALPLDGSVTSRGYEIAMYGYAIMAVEADNVEEDFFFPGGEDFIGKIVFAKPEKLVKRKKRKKRKNFLEEVTHFLPPCIFKPFGRLRASPSEGLKIPLTAKWEVKKHIERNYL